MLYFATGNKGKFVQVQPVLAEYGVELEQKQVEFEEPDCEDLKEIALAKARQAFQQLKQPLIVEDTGFFLEAHPGFPGPHTKWVFEKIGFEGFLKLLSGKSKKGFFKTIICFIDGKDSFKFFEGEWHGRISSKISEKSSKTLPYAQFFIGEGEKMPSIEMSAGEKAKKSQRGIASNKLGTWLKEKALHELLDSI